MLRLNVDAAKQKARLEQLVPTLSPVTSAAARSSSTAKRQPASPVTPSAIAGELSARTSPRSAPSGPRTRTARSHRLPQLQPGGSFEPITVATSDGKVFNGLLRGETADDRLATGVNQEARIARRRSKRSAPAPSRSCPPASTSNSLTRSWPTWSRFSKHASNPVKRSG